MKLNFPTVRIFEKELIFETGKYCTLPTEYSKPTNQKILNDFYRKIIEDKKGCCKALDGTDPLGFDYVIIDYICYIGLIFISENSSIKNTNKKNIRIINSQKGILWKG